MIWVVIGNALFIFGLRLIDVTLGTIRFIMINRGQKVIAPILGFIEVTIWIIAVSQVIGNLDNVWQILGYSGGFAAGTWIGMMIEERWALGQVEVNVISTDKSLQIAEKLRASDFGVTTIRAAGQSNAFDLVSTVAPRKQADKIIALIEEIDPESFVTVDTMKEVRHGYMHHKK